MEYIHGPGFFDAELASAIIKEQDSQKCDQMIDGLNEEEAKAFCKFLMMFIK